MEMTPQHDTNIPNGTLRERQKVDQWQAESHRNVERNYLKVW